ncbi:TPA: DsbA family protein [Vibrio vulnificus]|uniref:DsbA family protein n=1 Tax=Vibrio vulnificus TaxID=672 RepID=UPI0019D4B4CA|nr:DsbA family protein [Vibrio vulnificus]MBN8146575.1 DsbA family protein [Vibrio vulnificus]HAS6162870.1 DsbA family protein [Vibrio vulnificus]HAS6182604.1 DsbA family protein [Vibrio vulnificus]HDY7676402.1 DsbA family protein [Vibrio vulnificus]HDY7729565.1 DsbA family protein [Vibrio vulnificus]
MKIKLYYVHDPMCSWCWGYKPTLEKLKQQLPGVIQFEYVVGGLAPDSTLPMPPEMQQKIESIWHQIEQRLGTQFNYEFWTRCTPVRSTYQACRAVIAAGFQDSYEQMLEAIQQAYYLHAMPPHDEATHRQLAQEIGLNVQQFENDVTGRLLEGVFEDQLSLARSLGVNAYPSLVLQINDAYFPIEIDYLSTEPTLKLIRERIVENMPAQ